MQMSITTRGRNKPARLGRYFILMLSQAMIGLFEQAQFDSACACLLQKVDAITVLHLVVRRAVEDQGRLRPALGKLLPRIERSLFHQAVTDFDINVVVRVADPAGLLPVAAFELAERMPAAFEKAKGRR